MSQRNYRKLKVGSRVIIRATPVRGVILERLDNVCLVAREDVIALEMKHCRELELLREPA
jgi:hypothetical protein